MTSKHDEMKRGAGGGEDVTEQGEMVARKYLQSSRLTKGNLVTRTLSSLLCSLLQFRLLFCISLLFSSFFPQLLPQLLLLLVAFLIKNQ